MEKTLYFSPYSLLRGQPNGKSNDVLFLEVEADFLDDKTIRLDLNIIFRPIAVKHGVFEKKDFYIGSTGAWVYFEAKGGEVKDYTRGTPLKVDYETTQKRSRKSTVKISPEVEIGSGPKVGLGEVVFGKDNESTFTAKFSGSELTLTDSGSQHRVEWEFVAPAGQIIRDYLKGNLLLFVEAFWNGDAKSGTIELRPSDVRFFDSERRIIGSKMYKAWLMLYTLVKKKEGRGVNSEPTIINFKEIR
jgi:hypothetical protein